MKSLHLWMALVYLLSAGIPAWQIIRHSEKEIGYFKQICEIDNFQNNIMADHTFLGPIAKIFIKKRKVHLPSVKEAQLALGEMPVLNDLEKNEKTAAVFWSWVLLLVSFIYLVLTATTRNKARSNRLLFTLTLISVLFFVVGITAPAMMIVVMSPSNAVVDHFVLDYSTRSILGVIFDLYSSSYWWVGICLTVFSVLIPIAKALLTAFAIEAASLSARLKISKFLSLIGKWSMADVFVAAILLANFAMKANQPTPQTDLILGFYYFLGYCLLSMVTTTLLHHQLERSDKKRKVKINLLLKGA